MSRYTNSLSRKGRGKILNRATEVTATKAPSRPASTPDVVVREGELGALVAVTSVARRERRKHHGVVGLAALAGGPGADRHLYPARRGEWRGRGAQRRLGRAAGRQHGGV